VARLAARRASDAAKAGTLVGKSDLNRWASPPPHRWPARLPSVKPPKCPQVGGRALTAASDLKVAKEKSECIYFGKRQRKGVYHFLHRVIPAIKRTAITTSPQHIPRCDVVSEAQSNHVHDLRSKRMAANKVTAAHKAGEHLQP